MNAYIACSEITCVIGWSWYMLYNGVHNIFCQYIILHPQLILGCYLLCICNSIGLNVVLKANINVTGRGKQGEGKNLDNARKRRILQMQIWICNSDLCLLKRTKETEKPVVEKKKSTEVERTASRILRLITCYK